MLWEQTSLSKFICKLSLKFLRRVLQTRPQEKQNVSYVKVYLVLWQYKLRDFKDLGIDDHIRQMTAESSSPERAFKSLKSFTSEEFLFVWFYFSLAQNWIKSFDQHDLFGATQRNRTSSAVFRRRRHRRRHRHSFCAISFTVRLNETWWANPTKFKASRVRNFTSYREIALT